MTLAAFPEATREPWARTRYCVPLAEARDADAIGGKAYALGRMLRAGVAVPDGFVITADALRVHLGASSTGSDAFARVRDAALPPDVRQEIARVAEELLADGPVVVRSSAIGEDGANESFAGQLDSILHVRDQASLERAVVAVWASLWSERVRFYREARHVAERGMGVVVQRQVDAVAAGVLFTRTISGEMLVEYTAGLADALVAGAVDPGRIAIDRETARVRELAGCSFALTSSHTASLRRLGVALEAEFGGPQDVEWALSANGTLFAVQSRPITAPLSVPAFERATVPSVWSNANINENFPHPVSPLLFSIASAGYTHYFRNLAIAFGVSPRRVRAMEPAFQEIIGLHGARMYYNLTSIHSVLRLAPFGGALTASFDTFVGADGAAVETSTPTWAGRFEQAAEVAIVGFKASRLFLDLGERITRFERVVDNFASRTTPAALDAMSLDELRAALSEFVDIRCNRWLDASLADAAAMISYGALERLLRRAYPESAVHASLLKAIPDVVSGEPVLRLWDLSRLVNSQPELRELVETGSPAVVLAAIHGDARFADFRVAFQSYLDDWGFRCSEELMLTSQSFQENPEPLIDMLRAYARVHGDSPRDALRAQAAERERETRRISSELSPTYAALLDILLPRTHASIRYRERARLKQALLYSRCRRIALAMGNALVRAGVFAERDDVFFCTFEELVTGKTPIGAVAARRAEHGRLSAMRLPDAFTIVDGEYVARGDQAPVGGDSRRLAGTPACGGRVTGRACVLRDVTEAEKLERGDVLVTKQTDPGWGPVFFLISGLVIERGGMLSHGAIIAREFGIPCVVGVRDAMDRIPSGATIDVNGDTGAVHVVA
jgi:pyruvate,water dikinase